MMQTVTMRYSKGYSLILAKELGCTVEELEYRAKLAAAFTDSELVTAFKEVGVETIKQFLIENFRVEYPETSDRPSPEVVDELRLNEAVIQSSDKAIVVAKAKLSRRQGRDS